MSMCMLMRHPGDAMKTGRLQVLTTSVFRDWLGKARNAGVCLAELVRTRCERKLIGGRHRRCLFVRNNSSARWVLGRRRCWVFKDGHIGGTSTALRHLTQQRPRRSPGVLRSDNVHLT